MYDYSNPNQDPPDYGDTGDWFYNDYDYLWYYDGSNEDLSQRWLRELEEFEQGSLGFLSTPIQPSIVRPVWIEFLLWSLAGLILIVGAHLFITH